jgi:DNA gyrase/topoisomerase IV subunit B
VDVTIKIISTIGSVADPTAESFARHVSSGENAPAFRKRKDMARKTATRKLRLPGKLADCSQTALKHRLFLSKAIRRAQRKQARNRDTQAIRRCAAES